MEDKLTLHELMTISSALTYLRLHWEMMVQENPILAVVYEPMIETNRAAAKIETEITNCVR